MTEQVFFGAGELRRAAALLAGEQSTRQAKLRIINEMTAIAAFAVQHHRWPAFRLRGNDAENRLALALHRLVVRLAKHDCFRTPPSPMETALTEDRACRRLQSERPADLEFWDLLQDEAEGSA